MNLKDTLQIGRALGIASLGSLLLLAAGTLLLSACGGGGGGGGGGSAAVGGVESSLNALGVDTTATPREDEGGDALPEEYSPFGSSWEVSKTSELAVLGVNAAGGSDPFTVLELTDDDGNDDQEILFSQSESEAPFARTSEGQSRSTRGATSGDIDGDGQEDLIVAYMDGADLRVRWVDDEASGFAVREDFLVVLPGVEDLVALAGDFDGDGRDELALGLSVDSRGSILFAEFTGDRVDLVGPRLDLFPSFTNPSINLAMAAGSIDHDRAEELAVVMNETFSSQGQCSYAIYDDLSTSFSKLADGDVRGRSQNGSTATALTATPAIGDVDGDNLGEVIFGGLTDFANNCESNKQMAWGRDDAVNGLTEFDAYTFTQRIEDCDNGSSYRFRWAYTFALDIDGDGLDEIAVNQHVFEDWTNAAPWTEVAEYELPDEASVRRNSNQNFTRGDTCFAMGDFTGDGREDIACYAQVRDEIVVYGVAQTDGFLSRQRTIDVQFQISSPIRNVLLIPVNIDTDSPVLKYDEGTYQLVFSEPVVLAALAAAPCQTGIGQNTDACRTAFGNTEVSGEREERSVSVTAKAVAGFEVDGGLTQSGLELRATLSRDATRIQARNYQLEKTILFTTGAGEDTVVFTTVPLDQYTYTLLSHPDPDLVGTEVVVSLPREPITLQVERSFYNQNVVSGGPVIDERVFQHQIGQVSSYLGPAEKNGLRAQFGGLQIGPQSVGQGSGDVELTLAVEEEISEGRSLETTYEFDMKATSSTVVAGVGVGYGTRDLLTVSSGQRTTYTGLVGSIEASRFADNQFSFGLFTYVYRDSRSGQSFQVLNYWVE